MPTYEYACRSCGHVWEAVQRISEDPVRECPNCKQQTAERQISAGGGFILKGGGWYSDLYGSAKPKPAGESSDAKPADAKAEPAKSESKSESKTESTTAPATKPSTKPPPPPAKSD